MHPAEQAREPREPAREGVGLPVHRSFRVGAVALVVAILLAYSNSLRVPFVFDDVPNIALNPIVHDLSLFLAPPRVDASTAPVDLVYGFRSRYVAFLSFALNYAVHGQSVVGYHVVNLAVHVASTLVLLALVRALLVLPAFDRSRLRGRESTVALVVGGLFALHPLQTQAVTYVVQRMTSLAGLFCLASLLLYVRARTAPSRRTALFLAVGSGAALVVAMATKQNAFAFPLVVLLAELTLFRGRLGVRWKWLAVPAFCLLVAAPALYRWAEGANAGAAPRFETGEPGDEISGSDARRTQVGVLTTYLRLFVLPVGQNLDHDAKIAKSWSPALFAEGALLASLLGAGLWLAARRGGADEGWRLVGLGIVWFFVMHGIESSGLAPLDPIFEHRMYLPSVGLCLALVVATVVALPEDSARAALAGLAAAAIVLGAATFVRNEVWRSELRLWRDVVAKSPNRVRALVGLGERLLELRRGQEAEPILLRAHELAPRHVGVLVHLGVLFRAKGDPARAEEFLRTAIELEPKQWVALINLGDLAVARGDLAAAEELYERATRYEQLGTLARDRLARLRREGAPARAAALAPAGTL